MQGVYGAVCTRNWSAVIRLFEDALHKFCCESQGAQLFLGIGGELVVSAGGGECRAIKRMYRDNLGGIRVQNGGVPEAPV